MITAIANCFRPPQPDTPPPLRESTDDDWDITKTENYLEHPLAHDSLELNDWVEIAEQREESSCLVQYRMVNGAPELSFNGILTEQSYRDLLQHIDLSYVLANSHTKQNRQERDSLTDRCQEIKDSLIKNGWDEKFPLFLGSTGAHNQDPDATGFSSYNKKHKLIVITFHGSRNGSKNPFADTDGAGDWGANYAWQAKTAKELGIHYLPRDIQVHGGFGRNFSSVQEQISDHLHTISQNMSEEELQGAWILVTGHSKGGGMANIAAPFIKCFLNEHSNEALRNLQVAAIPVSSPRVFYGDETKKWVDHIVGKRNILRINVSGDIVPLTIPRALGGRSVGILALDKSEQVQKRCEQIKKTKLSENLTINTRLSMRPNTVSYHFGRTLTPSELFIKRLIHSQAIQNSPPKISIPEGLASLHYGSKFRSSGFSFTPELLPGSLPDLLEAVEQGTEHRPSEVDGPSFFHTPMNLSSIYKTASKSS